MGDKQPPAPETVSNPRGFSELYSNGSRTELLIRLGYVQDLYSSNQVILKHIYIYIYICVCVCVCVCVCLFVCLLYVYDCAKSVAAHGIFLVVACGIPDQESNPAPCIGSTES